ncbi:MULTISPECIES: GntR family transcriptional regulator [Gracilibacillus]|uniref:GntR family transcriptional regulator n=1 Tax=Gracilibacillus TaxID=74385 RepID=UPI0008246B24|nr:MULTISPECIES: GntR family transcriptional regulator [Gracilibacillus]
MFELDLRSRQPIYEQLVDKFKQLIMSEVLQQDEQLPSVRSLAQDLSINPNTIQKAYRELEAQGYIYSVKGKGSFVSQISQIDNTAEIKEIREHLKRLMVEAFFLGMTNQEMKQIIEESQTSVLKGDAYDPD